MKSFSFLALASAGLLSAADSPVPIQLHQFGSQPLRDAAINLRQFEGGDEVLNYLTRCALSEGVAIAVPGEKGEKVFRGSNGLAPKWANRALTTTEQRWVSGCMLALMNATGQHIQIAMLGDHPSLAGELPEKVRFFEGAFYGNIFLKQPIAYACRGNPNLTGSPTRSARRCTDTLDESGVTLCDMTFVGYCNTVCNTASKISPALHCIGDRQRFNEVVSVYLENEK